MRALPGKQFLQCLRRFTVIVWLCALTAGAVGATVEMRMAVDARDLPRKLLHTRIEMPVQPGPLMLWYPKWIPGIHAPRGPIENLAGLRIEGDNGETIHWNRDRSERFLFHCEIPEGVNRIVIRLDYICNQPTTNSRGIDSFGNSLIGVINWNTCLLYPDGYTSEEVLVDLSLWLPENWKWGSSLREERTDADGIHFERISLHDLVDSPMIMGEHFRKFPLEVSNIPPITLHVTSESAAALQLPDEIVKHYGNIATEAGLMLGSGHFDRYEWLVYCSDDFPRTGLEHLKSSLNGVGERDLLSVEKLQGWAGGLLPHELAHSWCGKFRRPAGMVTPDFHTDKDTRLLWVYEGLTTYLEGVWVVCGGLWSFERFKDDLADTISSYKHQMGRQWRPLEDTAVDSYHLRGGSQAWSKLRRNQDYYAEGALLWLEVDAIIRTKTDGNRSLDDFCKSFLGAGYPDKKTLPYELDDIIEELEALADHDWRGLIEQRIQRPQERLPLDVVPMLGYRLQFSSTPSESLANQEKDEKFASAIDSIGMRVNKEGIIHSALVPGMPADEAGLAPGMKIVGVNGRKFSLDRFREGIADSVVNNGIEFLVLDGDVYRTFHVDYADGPRYLELVRDESRADLLSEIYRPRQAGAELGSKQ